MWRGAEETPLEDTNTKGDEIQKLSVIQTLPNLLTEDPQTCMQRLIPKMQQTLPNASTEFHVTASSTFKTILEQKLVSPSTFTQTFLQSILNSLDTRDPVLAYAWLETLLDAIELLPTDVIRREILPVAVNKGQLSEPVSSRIICCKIIGKICTRFDSQLIKKEVLPTVHSLCQDVNSDVRACICSQLRYVAEGLGADSVTASLLPSIVELASDEESIVRHASVETIVDLLPHFQTDTMKSTISPLIKKICDNAIKTEDSVMCTIAQEFGKLALGLQAILTSAEKSWLIKYFQTLSKLGITSSIKEDVSQQQQQQQQQEVNFLNNTLMSERQTECRRQCAYNMPAIFLFSSSNWDDVDLLIATLTELANDPYYLVRRTLACGFHEVVKIMGPKCGSLKTVFVKILKDEHEEVLQGIIPHISKTLELFVQNQIIGTEAIDFSIVETGRALLKCEAEIFNTNNWRLSSLIFEQWEVLPKCFPSDYIYTYFVPVVFNRALNARPIPIKLAAGRTLLIFMRYNLKPVQRTELRDKLYTDFARNSNSYVRMLFIRMMIEASDIFSSVYFKDHFFSTLLELCEDSIANIRLKVVTLLPNLKSLLRLPSDKKLLTNFEASVRGLMNNEKDRDVIFALTESIRKLDDINVRHEGQATTSTSNSQETEDLRKYEEERQLLSVNSGKSLIPPTSQTKKPLVGKINGSNNIPASSNKLTAMTSDKNPSRTLISATSSQKMRHASPSVSDTFKTTKHTKTTSKSTDSARASSSSSRTTTTTTTTTSSNNLASNWSRLKSNPMLLTHIWEKTGDHTNRSTLRPQSSDYIQDKCCNCYQTQAFIYPPTMNISTPYLDYKYSSQSDSEINASKKTSSRIHLRKDYFDPCVLTNPPPQLTEKKQEPAFATFDYAKSSNFSRFYPYHSYWNFSSTPEIPVTLLDDEFLVDTGVRIPDLLSSSHSLRGQMKLPNLQDIIHRNARIENFTKRRSESSAKNMNRDKSSSASHHFSMYDESIENTSDKLKPMYSNRLYTDFGDSRTPSKSSILEDNLRFKQYSPASRKETLNFDSMAEQKCSSIAMQRDKKNLQLHNLPDRSKRYSANYGVKPPSLKDAKHKFKRHSVEVTNYQPVEKTDKKRHFGLDVNHNQGGSKIPLKTSSIASGSRTAPSTRTSSPIKLTYQLDIDKEHKEISGPSHSDQIVRFSSSEEEVDKLCIRFAYVDSEYVMRSESHRSKQSKLPVWIPRKKS